MNSILVFDTGKGGEYVAAEAKKRFPDYDIDFLADEKGLPYGNKKPQEIINFAISALRPKIDKYDFIVIACHTLTQVGIEDIRKEFPHKTFVGFDPGIKKAYDLCFRNVCVFATPATLESKRYKEIKEGLEFEKITEPDCTSWASAIEDEIFEPKLMVNEVISAGSPCVVLACTHYFLYEDLLGEYFDDLAIINPTHDVLNQLGRLLTAS